MCGGWSWDINSEAWDGPVTECPLEPQIWDPEPTKQELIQNFRAADPQVPPQWTVHGYITERVLSKHWLTEGEHEQARFSTSHGRGWPTRGFSGFTLQTITAWQSESCSVVSNSLWPHGLHSYTAHGILQARILEWVALPFSRGSSQPRDQTLVSHIAGRFFTSRATREAQEYWSG